MKHKRDYNHAPIFPDLLTTESDDIYEVPDEDVHLLLNDSFYPGTEGPTIQKQPLKGAYLLPIYTKILIFCFLAFVARVWSLQISHNQEFTSLAEGRRVALELVSAPRGIIYDQARRPLASNTARLDLTILPAGLPEEVNQKNAIFNQLASMTKISEDTIRETLKKSAGSPSLPVTIVENLDRNIALTIASLHLELPGVQIEQRAGRSYAKDASLSHILGYIGAISEEDIKKKNADETEYMYEVNDKIGKTGIEASYENVLRGKKDIKKIEVNNVGAQVRLLKKAEPITGSSLLLTVDLELQKKLRELLLKSMDSNKVKAAVGIVQNPNNGDILAMVSLPDFDNNLFVEGISQKAYEELISPDSNNPLLNRAIAGQYPPGSVFKPFVAMAGLESGNITAATSFIDPGVIRIGNSSFPNWLWKKSGITFGAVNVESSLEASVDTFYYTIAGGYEDHTGMGSDIIRKWVNMFGFGNVTGIDLPNEQTGDIPSLAIYQQLGKTWTIGDTYHMSIGQGDILATPLQIVNATSVIANGGTLYQPRLMKELLSEDQTTLFPQPPIILDQDFVSKAHLAIVKQGMYRVIYGSHGTAKDLSSLPFKVAGKTGTAQFMNNQKEHAWFTAFAPYNEPEVSVVILIEGGGEGSKVAAPVARELLGWFFRDRYPYIEQDNLVTQEGLYNE